jgi:hypothetical protein
MGGKGGAAVGSAGTGPTGAGGSGAAGAAAVGGGAGSFGKGGSTGGGGKGGGAGAGGASAVGGSGGSGTGGSGTAGSGGGSAGTGGASGSGSGGKAGSGTAGSGGTSSTGGSAGTSAGGSGGSTGGSAGSNVGGNGGSTIGGNGGAGGSTTDTTVISAFADGACHTCLVAKVGMGIIPAAPAKGIPNPIDCSTVVAGCGATNQVCQASTDCVAAAQPKNPTNLDCAVESCALVISTDQAANNFFSCLAFNCAAECDATDGFINTAMCMPLAPRCAGRAAG